MEIIKQVQTIQNQQESLPLSTKLETKLEDEEKKIWQLQFAKPAFGKYGEGELLVQVQILIAKICIITGWVLPNDDGYVTILNDQMAKKFKEDYYALNADEVEYAFRKYGTTSEDWGKSFNLNLVDKVLVKYMNFRSDLRKFVDNLHENEEPKALPPVPKQSDQEFIEEWFEMWRGYKNKFYQYTNHKVYDKLQKIGLMNLSEEDKMRIRATVKLDNREKGTSNFGELRHRLKEIESAPDGEYINRMAKKYAVAEFFNKLIEQGKLKVF